MAGISKEEEAARMALSTLLDVAALVSSTVAVMLADWAMLAMSPASNSQAVSGPLQPP
jgi:hypothetical protein